MLEKKTIIITFVIWKGRNKFENAKNIILFETILTKAH